VRPAELAAVAAFRAELASGKARTARESAGLSPAEVASALGVSRQTVGLWESGKRKPTAEHALAYGRLLARLSRKVA
jgi:DNA-binding XRE family transcriptional regulator